VTGLLPSVTHFFTTDGAMAEADGATVAAAAEVGATSAVAATVGAADAEAVAVAVASILVSSALVHAASKQTVTNANFFIIFSNCNGS
jgi:hypothetical protein